MQVLEHHSKGAHLNTLERFHVYAEYATDNHLNDNHTVFPNKIFNVLLKTPPFISTTPPTQAPWEVTHPIPPNTGLCPSLVRKQIQESIATLFHVNTQSIVVYGGGCDHTEATIL